MKKIRTGKVMLWAGATMLASAVSVACGRPTYWVRVADLQSDCDDGVRLRIVHDPEPEGPAAHIDDAFAQHPDAQKILFLRSDAKYLHVGFVSGVVCKFLADEPQGECTKTAHSDDAASCSATMKLVALEPPTRHAPGPGERMPRVGD